MLLAELDSEIRENGQTEIFVRSNDPDGEYALIIAPTAGLSGLGIETSGGVVITREGARVLAPLTEAAIDVALDLGNVDLAKSLASVQRQVKSKL